MINQISIEPTAVDFVTLSKRPELDLSSMQALMHDIFSLVSDKGDDALRELTAIYDGVKTEGIKITKDEIEDAFVSVPNDLKDAMKLASENITKFHSTQLPRDIELEVMDGVTCSQKSTPIYTVGLYIPGGTAPLFSTVLMLAIPAKLAGCSRIVMCTPPGKDGKINSAILAAARLCGVTEVYAVGGAQAIAAMSIGTETMPKVSKIYGPGNQYVTAAKSYAQKYGVAMDMPAGPSEVLVYADNSCVPEFVAADLLSQAEHGADSQVILVAADESIVLKVNEAIEVQVQNLPRKEVAKLALANSRALVIADVSKAWDYINTYAPEHLIIASELASNYISLVKNAGSVFVGNYSPESVGDYASGTNHTLPTAGWAISYSGVNVDAFMKKVTFQQLTKKGLQSLGPTVMTLASAEQLEAHSRAVGIRLENPKK